MLNPTLGFIIKAIEVTLPRYHRANSYLFHFSNIEETTRVTMRRWHSRGGSWSYRGGKVAALIINTTIKFFRQCSKERTENIRSLILLNNYKNYSLFSVKKVTNFSGGPWLKMLVQPETEILITKIEISVQIFIK